MSWKTYSAVIQVEALRCCTSASIQSRLPDLAKEVWIVSFVQPNILVFKSDAPEKTGKKIERWLKRHWKK